MILIFFILQDVDTAKQWNPIISQLPNNLVQKGWEILTTFRASWTFLFFVIIFNIIYWLSFSVQDSVSCYGCDKECENCSRTCEKWLSNKYDIIYGFVKTEYKQKNTCKLWHVFALFFYSKVLQVRNSSKPFLFTG